MAERGTWAAVHRQEQGDRLFSLSQLAVEWDAPRGTLWTFMRPRDRPNFNLAMLHDFEAWQDGIVRHHAASGAALRYVVLGSRFPGVFNLGGDLELFSGYIRERDREGLANYGKTCVRILHRNMCALDLPVVTIGLVQGDALGGGFEALLSFNVVVAERNARFGLPETLFNLFPGMGAQSFLTRLIGERAAERMIFSGQVHTAEQLYDMGLVHVLAEPGEGEAAVRDYIDRNAPRQRGHYGVFRAARAVDPIALGELEDIVDLWADAALHLRDQDLKLMKRLATAQTRLAQPAAARP